MDLERREFILVGATSLSGATVLQLDGQPNEEYEFRGIGYLVGPSDAKPAIGDRFFDNKIYFGYIYLAHDTERQFYTDERLDYWLELPPFAPSVEYHGDTISNTTTETQIASYEFPNNTIQQDGVYKYNVMGSFSTASTSDFVTLRFYQDSQVLGEVESAGKNSDAAPWRASLTLTYHLHNGTAHAQPHVVSTWDDEESDDSIPNFEVDITTINELRVTVEWNNAKTGNSITRRQGYVERWR